ncbi:phytase [Streptomyces sp. A1547]|uniref:phytase n=1 Tax=Streptomyces sp. A1547 TaxID=2563105 RepID=UPI00109EBCBC|nr:phytase [Streptomyces sp. A1547]THA40773.1 phytase [Streptomyces sp. A1547]
MTAALAVLAGLTAAAPAAAQGRKSGPLPAVTPVAETATLFDDEEGGNANADDPAIWRNSADPDRSLVVATAKEGGLRVYDLGAREVQALPAPSGPGPKDSPGRFNNVDLVHQMRQSGGRADLAVVTDRGNDRLRFYRIDRDRPGGPLTDVTAPTVPAVFSASQEEINDQRTAYGLATWTDRSTGRSYAGQEDVGIWRMRADLTSAPVLVDRVREYGVPATYDEETEECTPGTDPGFGGRRLSADVEGLTIVDEGDGEGYLMASSQGDNTFAFYDRERKDGHEYEGGVRITARSRDLDGSEECDGAAALNQPLGRAFPRGLLVVQDGHDAPEDGPRTATGFKFVDLGKVLDALDD